MCYLVGNIALHMLPFTHLFHCLWSQAATAVKAQMAIRHHMDNLLSWNGVLVMPTALGPPPALDSVTAPETRRRLVALGSIAGLCGLPQACLHPLPLAHCPSPSLRAQSAGLLDLTMCPVFKSYEFLWRVLQWASLPSTLLALRTCFHWSSLTLSSFADLCASLFRLV